MVADSFEVQAIRLAPAKLNRWQIAATNNLIDPILASQLPNREHDTGDDYRYLYVAIILEALECYCGLCRAYTYHTEVRREEVYADSWLFRDIWPANQWPTVTLRDCCAAIGVNLEQIRQEILSIGKPALLRKLRGERGPDDPKVKKRYRKSKRTLEKVDNGWGMEDQANSEDLEREDGGE